MKKDIYKLGGWLEKACQEGIADEQALAKWKLVQRKLEPGGVAAACLETPLMDEVVRSGFDSPGAIIHVFVGGSELHGAKVGTTDDLDIYGTFSMGLLMCWGWNQGRISCGQQPRMPGGMGQTMLI
jgi:hypothetical protein